MKRIAILCTDRCLASSIGLIIDSYRLVNVYVQRRSLEREAVPPPAKVVLLSSRGGPIVLGGGLMTVQTEPVYACPQADAVVIPSTDFDPSSSLADIIDHFDGTAGGIAKLHKQGAMVAAAGPSVAIVLEAGLGAEARLAAPWWLHKAMHQRYRPAPFAIDEQVAQSDRIITATGVAAEFDLARRLVAATLSPYVAAWLSRSLGRAGSDLFETQDVIDKQEIADPLIAQVRLWLDENFTRQVKMREIADLTGVSERTLVRRFERQVGTSPHAYLQTLRIDIAKKMLSRTTRSVERIANLVGYSDTRYFRSLFLQKVGVTPGGFRRAAGQQTAAAVI